MRRLVTAAVLLLLGSSAYAQTTCSATCRACGSTVVGGSGGAPTDAQYVTAAADATLSAERVCTDTTTIDCDAGTAGQMKFNLITPIQVATGCATPNFGFVDDSGAGVCLNAADVARLQIGTTDYVQVDTNQFIYVKGGATVMTVTGNGLTFGSTAGTADWFVLTPQAAGAAGRYGELTTADLTANRTFTFPDATGDVAVIASTGFPVRTAAQTWATRCLAAGTGVSIANECGLAGNITVSLDTATTPQHAFGTGDVPATGTQGTWYYETDVPSIYAYPTTDTETWVMSMPAGQTAGRLFQTTATDQLVEITPTDETVLVSNGSTWEKKTLPDCTDTGGNHINYTASSNTFSCGTTGAAASFDPTTTFDLMEEFAGGVHVTSGQVGTHGWRYTPISAGTASGAIAAASHPAILDLNSHAANDNSGVEMVLDPDTSGGSNGKIGMAVFDGNEWSMEALVKFSSVTNVAMWFGISSAMPDAVSIGSWIRFDTDKSDTTFVFQICDSSTNGCAAAGDDTNSSVVASTKTPATNTWYRLRMRRVASGVGGNPTWYFSVGSAGAMETEKTFCPSGCDDTLANLNTAAPGSGRPTIMFLTRTTSGVQTMSVDYFRLQVTGMSRY